MLARIVNRIKCRFGFHTWVPRRKSTLWPSEYICGICERRVKTYCDDKDYMNFLARSPGKGQFHDD